MGFGGGGGGALPNHEHTNIPLSGGPLDFNNTTIASLLAGSITYSNGSALQELVAAADGTVLGLSGGVPAWVTSGAAAVMTINGQMIYFDGSRTALNIGNENDQLTVSAGGLPVWTAPVSPSAPEYYTNGSDVTIASQTTYETVPNMSNITLTANSVYGFDLLVIWSNGDGNTNFKWQFAGTGISINRSEASSTDTTSSQEYTNNSGFASFSNMSTDMEDSYTWSDSGTSCARWYGTLETDGSDRTLDFEFAQALSKSASSSIKAGSVLVLYKYIS